MIAAGSLCDAEAKRHHTETGGLTEHASRTFIQRQATSAVARTGLVALLAERSLGVLRADVFCASCNWRADAKTSDVGAQVASKRQATSG